MLCDIAVRLAVAKGLHRQPIPSFHLSQQEISQRNQLFWAAYCQEKQIVVQSGRASVREGFGFSPLCHKANIPRLGH